MDENLTSQQRAAVVDRGRGMLVSAAAGSGKTKVLVERLFSYVEREGANLDDFLIITYTRAAAAELRGKIAAALLSRLQEDPSNAHLQHQMLRVYRADIKTVDSFCTTLLRENCHLLGEDEQHRSLRPDFRVLDEHDAASLRERVLARTLDDFYEGLSTDDGGMLLADTLGAGRDDRSLASLVLELHGKVQAQAYPEQWLNSQEKAWSNVPGRIDDIEYGKLLLSLLGVKARHWAALLSQGADEMQCDDALSEKYAPQFMDASEQLEVFAEAAERGWDDARGITVVYPKLSQVRKAEDPKFKNRMLHLWRMSREFARSLPAWLEPSCEEAADDLRAMAPAMVALLRLTSEFSRAYSAEKRRRNTADFADQEHLAIKLLLGDNGVPTQLAAAVGDRYREIMVDEYQDTNEVQNRIFEAISHGGGNLFTVGDVKQSIYRFRLADPAIFLDHYSRFPGPEAAKPGESIKLILSKNFRSRREVLDAANFVFSNILSREMGELDYGKDEALYLGADYPENVRCAVEFHLLNKQRGNSENPVSSSQAEAAFVAEYIRRLLDEGFPVTDDVTRLPRPAREEDIVILMRSPSARILEFKRALEMRGIGVSADAGEDFFASMEVSVMFSLLEILDNPRQDVPLISVLRSPLFGFSADRLSVLRGARKTGDFYDALLSAGDEDTDSFISTLGALRQSAQTLSVRRLIARIFDECNVLGVFGAMDGGCERKENLLAFAALAERFESSGYCGLFSFVTHLRELRDGGELYSQRPPQNASGVRIMSIHKSKGLEFPIVILADLAKRFNNMDFTGSVLVHPKYGIGPQCVDTERRIRYPTVARQAIEHVLKRETKAEEMRLLYVAMTRAKEKLVMVHTQTGAPKRLGELMATASCPALPESVDGAKCLGDWVLLPLLCRPEAEPLRELTDSEAAQTITANDCKWEVFVHSCDEEENSDQTNDGETAGTFEEDDGIAPDTDTLLWNYPYPASTQLSAKITATQLKGRESDAEIAENAALPARLRSIARPRFMDGKKKLKAAERGTALHLVMEHISFDCASSADAVRAQINGLAERRLITQDQADAVDAELIASFLGSDIAERIRKGSNLNREYRFSILDSARKYDQRSAEDDEVLVQGVVDCFFEEQGQLVVLDFKTDRVTADTVAKRAEYYAPQLETYSSALERIMGKKVKERILYFFETGQCVNT